MNTQTLIANLASDDEIDRIYAAEDLGYAKAPEAIAPLVALLTKEHSRKVRETILLSLERIDHPEVVSQVIALLDSDDAFLRNQTVGLLQRKGAVVVPSLMAKMQLAGPDVRKFILDTAAGISSPTVDPIYDTALRDSDINVVIAALEALGAHRMTRFKSAAEQIFLKATVPMMDYAALGALLQIGDATSWDCIRQKFPTVKSVPGWELGLWIRALGEFGPAGEIGVFHELLRSHDGKVVRDATDALECFQVRHGRMEISEEFWTLLQEMLQADMAPEDRLQLLRLIGGFGAPAAIADYLVSLLEQSDRLTKLGAIEGIKRLGRPDLLELLRNRPGLASDAEMAEALGLS
jgi:HEAT repeat protein